MKVRVNICDKHYGFVDVTVDNVDDALESADKAVDEGEAIWTHIKTVSANIDEITITCSHCGHDFTLSHLQKEDEAWQVRCPLCEYSTVFALPNNSATLQKMFAYCRVECITYKCGCWHVKYRCDTSAPPERSLQSVSLCGSCRRVGCHIHTAAIDCELLLDGEKRFEDLSDYWKV